MKISPVGIELIKRNEGCRLNAYQDVVGVWTIGYGHTEGVHPGLTITQEQADKMLVDELNNVYGPGVERALAGSPTTQSQFDALVSLAYNIGIGGFTNSQAVTRQHKLGNYQAAADGFLLWNKAGGKELSGLTRRRHEERSLYLNGIYNGKIECAKSMQLALKTLGLYTGSIDGSWGPLSRSAYDKFINSFS